MALPIDSKQRWQFLTGRNKYNAKRQRKAQNRRMNLINHISRLDRPLKHGDVKRLAEIFDCHRSTIWRDLKLIDESGRCHYCGQPMPWLVDR